MQTFRLEGLTLTVADVAASIAFYAGKLGLTVAYGHAPEFALIRSQEGGTIGLLSVEEATKEGVRVGVREQYHGVHVEFTTDDLNSLHTELVAAGVEFAVPPHDEPWERSMTAYDPDGYAVEFAQGRRGTNSNPSGAS